MSVKYEYTITLWCLCRLPEFASKNMTLCPGCRSWFHKPYVGLTDTTQNVVKFKCRECQSKKLAKNK